LALVSKEERMRSLSSLGRVVCLRFSTAHSALSAFDFASLRHRVREAYFLGQRHDDSPWQAPGQVRPYCSLPGPAPTFSPSVFLPHMRLRRSIPASKVSIYSAQQAQLDHLKNPEVVRVTAQISLTDSYGPYISAPTDPIPIRSRESSCALRTSGAISASAFSKKDQDGHSHHRERRSPLSVHGRCLRPFRCNSNL